MSHIKSQYLGFYELYAPTTIMVRIENCIMRANLVNRTNYCKSLFQKQKKNIGILLKLEEHTRQLGHLFCVLETVTLRQNKK